MYNEKDICKGVNGSKKRNTEKYEMYKFHNDSKRFELNC